MPINKKLDPAYALGILFVVIMTAHSVSRARSGYDPVSSYNKDPDTAYIADCEWTQDEANVDAEGNPDGTTTTKTYKGVNNGDTALMMFGTTLVMFQTPAMGIAQAGMIRRKNSLSMMMQCTSGMAIGSLLWYVVGYSLTFGPDVGGIIGDPWPFLFFRDMPRSATKCLSIAPSIPGPLFASFQMMFALMVPVIVTGAWAEKFKMEAFVLFMVFWPLLVYYPVAHWIWGGGWMAELGCLDFAGGITIHTTAGVAAMVVSNMLKPRRNMERLAMTHHNISLLVIGGTIIWAGWYSFNGCSALVGGATAGAALLNTHISASVSGLTWVLLTYRNDGCFHVTDMMNGAFAGLAGVTPGSGFIPSQAAFCYGIIIGSASWYSCGFCKNRLKIDDVLDVFSLQAVPGAIGSILVGVFAGGEPYGVEAWGSGDGSAEDNLGLVWGGNGRLLAIQILCVVVAAIETAVATWGLMKGINYFVGTEITVQEEDDGLDKSQIGEVGYDYESPVDTLPLDDNELAVQLIEAAAHGNLSKCKHLVQAGAKVTGTDYDKRTALHLAAAEGRMEVIKWLIQQVPNADVKKAVNAVDAFDGTPLEGAMENGHAAAVAFLRSKGGELTNTDKYVYMLCNNAYAGKIDQLRSLVEGQGVAVNLSDYDTRTALHVAAASGQASAVAYLLKAKADTTIKDRWGQTAMDGAGTRQVIEMLGNPTFDWSSTITAQAAPKGGDANAKISPTDGGGASEESTRATKELLDAASSGDLALVKTLVARGTDCGASDYDRRTALHIACAAGHRPMVQFLLKQPKVVVNCTDRFDISPLFEASRNKHTAIVDLLKSKGAVAMNQNSGFALCTAAANNNIEKLEQLHMQGVDLSTADYDGRTALHLGVSNGHQGVVDWLLATGDVQVNVVDRLHHTPLDDAIALDKGKGLGIKSALRAAGAISWDEMNSNGPSSMKSLPPAEG